MEPASLLFCCAVPASESRVERTKPVGLDHAGCVRPSLDEHELTLNRLRGVNPCIKQGQRVQRNGSRAGVGDGRPDFRRVSLGQGLCNIQPHLLISFAFPPNFSTSGKCRRWRLEPCLQGVACISSDMADRSAVALLKSRVN